VGSTPSVTYDALKIAVEILNKKRTCDLEVFSFIYAQYDVISDLEKRIDETNRRIDTSQITLLEVQKSLFEYG
jgi:hypothetical protein